MRFFYDTNESIETKQKMELNLFFYYRLKIFIQKINSNETDHFNKIRTGKKSS